MKTLYLTDKIQIAPDETALQKLWDISYICKDIWNILNDEKQSNGGSYYKLKKMLPEIKAGCDRLRLPSSQVLQEVVKSLNSAWQMYFTKRKNGDKEVKPPRFKSYKYFFTQKYPQAGVSFEIIDNALGLAYGRHKADWVKISLPERDYSHDTIKTVIISYDKSQKKWYVSLTREVVVPEPIAEGHTIYFDPGCKTTLTGIKTDCTIWEYDINPLRELNFRHYQLIDRLKSRRDKKKRGSRQHRRLNAKVRSIYRKINTQTRHYLHKLANRILNDHSDTKCFMFGDWDKKDSLADTGYSFIDKRINRQVQNNNPVRKLVGYLNYKALLRGQQVDNFNEKGTTETCSRCDYVLSERLAPSIRVFKCPVCNFKAGRDINSVLNFLKTYQYALWQGLRAVVSLSIARTLLNPSSGKNRTVFKRQVVLNYQDARSF